jgi:hypothetical protein
MKDYFYKQYQRAKLHFQNLRSKAVVRMANLAKRRDPSHYRAEKKK